MRGIYENSVELDNFLVEDYRDFAGSGAIGEEHFEEGLQTLSEVGHDIDLDIDQNWLENEDLDNLDLLTH